MAKEYENKIIQFQHIKQWEQPKRRMEPRTNEEIIASRLKRAESFVVDAFNTGQFEYFRYAHDSLLGMFGVAAGEQLRNIRKRHMKERSRKTRRSNILRTINLGTHQKGKEISKPKLTLVRE